VIRPWGRRNILTFIFSQNSKHVLFRIFRIYRIFRVKIVLQNTCSNLNSDSKIWLQVWNAGPYCVRPLVRVQVVELFLLCFLTTLVFLQSYALKIIRCLICSYSQMNKFCNGCSFKFFSKYFYSFTMKWQVHNKDFVLQHSFHLYRFGD